MNREEDARRSVEANTLTAGAIFACCCSLRAGGCGELGCAMWDVFGSSWAARRFKRAAEAMQKALEGMSQRRVLLSSAMVRSRFGVQVAWMTGRLGAEKWRGATIGLNTDVINISRLPGGAVLETAQRGQLRGVELCGTGRRRICGRRKTLVVVLEPRSGARRHRHLATRFASRPSSISKNRPPRLARPARAVGMPFRPRRRTSLAVWLSECRSVVFEELIFCGAGYCAFQRPGAVILLNLGQQRG